MHHTANASTVVDPVCGMTVDLAHAAGTSRYAATTFHFCAASCKTAFDAAPTKYASQGESAAASCCSAGSHCSTSSAH